MTSSLRALCLCLLGAVAPSAPTPVDSVSSRFASFHGEQQFGLAGATAASAASIEVETDLKPEHTGAIRARASVFVHATPEQVRDAVLDLQARADEGWMVDAVSVYRDKSSADHIHRRARWELSILGIEIVYHCRYDWDRERSEIRWSLDDSRENDLELAEGIYELDARSGGTRLTYTVEVGSEHRAAKPLKRSITARNVRKLLESVRERAEGGR